MKQTDLTRAERRVVTAAMSRARRWRAYQDEEPLWWAYERARNAEDAACAALESLRREARKGKGR